MDQPRASTAVTASAKAVPAPLKPPAARLTHRQPAPAAAGRPRQAFSPRALEAEAHRAPAVIRAATARLVAPRQRLSSTAAHHRSTAQARPSFWQNFLEIFGGFLFFAGILLWIALGGWLGFGVFMACLVVVLTISLWGFFKRGELT